ncbi:MAG TPA: LamG-like jellyroll fold domain-containing protein [Fibrobacteraceae bacterium]|nr:LamG-like jellyroll fold domain-containing protein [Fibrobacteraceae bacterium]
MSSVRHRRWIACGIFFALLMGCSDRQIAGGNSAESGNPELVGILELPDGTPAAHTQVQCVPEGFNAKQDTLSSTRITYTDSTGAYVLDSLPTGICALEACDTASGMRLLISHISLNSGQTDTLNGALQLPGALRIKAESQTDGDSGYVVVSGTSILRFVVVKFGAIFVDSLPATESLPLLKYYSLDGEILSQINGLTVTSDDTLPVNSPPLIHLAWKVKLNTSATGADLSEDLLAFPLSLRTDSLGIDFTVISPEAGSFQAWKSDSATELPLAISYWSATDSAGQFWAQLDTLYAQDSTQFIWLTYSEGDTATSASTPFSSSNGYLGVWHFDEGTSVATDASGNGWDGEPTGTTDSVGVAGRAFLYDGRSSYVTIPNTASSVFNFNYLDTLSISLWVNVTDISANRFILSKGAYQYYLMYYYPHGWQFVNYEEEQASYDDYLAEADTSTVENQWHLLTVTQSNDETRLFVDDSLQDSIASVGVADSARNTDQDIVFGRICFSEENTDFYYFVGLIDEIEISGVARSAEWIRLTYLNQKPEKPWPWLSMDNE